MMIVLILGLCYSTVTVVIIVINVLVDVKTAWGITKMNWDFDLEMVVGLCWDLRADVVIGGVDMLTILAIVAIVSSIGQDGSETRVCYPF